MEISPKTPHQTRVAEMNQTTSPEQWCEKAIPLAETICQQRNSCEESVRQPAEVATERKQMALATHENNVYVRWHE